MFSCSSHVRSEGEKVGCCGGMCAQVSLQCIAGSGYSTWIFDMTSHNVTMTHTGTYWDILSVLYSCKILQYWDSWSQLYIVRRVRHSDIQTFLSNKGNIQIFLWASTVQSAIISAEYERRWDYDGYSSTLLTTIIINRGGPTPQEMSRITLTLNFFHEKIPLLVLQGSALWNM